jgi:coproporphyrinogen III oxidase-like Fe-S oxidoreductase
VRSIACRAWKKPAPDRRGAHLQFRSINIDLIYGLPKQTPEGFARTVEEVIRLQPDRLSVFNYAHLPERFMPQRRIDSNDLPAPRPNWRCCTPPSTN